MKKLQAIKEFNDKTINEIIISTMFSYFDVSLYNLGELYPILGDGDMTILEKMDDDIDKTIDFINDLRTKVSSYEFFNEVFDSKSKLLAMFDIILEGDILRNLLTWVSDVRMELFKLDVLPEVKPLDIHLSSLGFSEVDILDDIMSSDTFIEVFSYYFKVIEESLEC